MMKIIYFIVAFASFGVLGVEVVNSPADIRLFCFCTIKQECRISISLTNTTSYDVKLNSHYFGRDSILNSSVLAFEAEKYHSLEVDGKDVYKSQITVSTKAGENLNSINLKPQQTKHYELVEIGSYFKFTPDTDYLVKLYIPHVSIYVDNEFVGTTSVKSNIGEVIFPTAESELK